MELTRAHPAPFLRFSKGPDTDQPQPGSYDYRDGVELPGLLSGTQAGRCPDHDFWTSTGRGPYQDFVGSLHG